MFVSKAPQLARLVRAVSAAPRCCSQKMQFFRVSDPDPSGAMPAEPGDEDDATAAEVAACASSKPAGLVMLLAPVRSFQ